MSRDNLYHIITISSDGEDEKPEARTRKEAFATARELLQIHYYNGVKIYHRGKLIKHYSAIWQRKIIIIKSNPNEYAN